MSKIHSFSGKSGRSFNLPLYYRVSLESPFAFLRIQELVLSLYLYRGCPIFPNSKKAICFLWIIGLVYTAEAAPAQRYPHLFLFLQKKGDSLILSKMKKVYTHRPLRVEDDNHTYGYSAPQGQLGKILSQKSYQLLFATKKGQYLDSLVFSPENTIHTHPLPDNTQGNGGSVSAGLQGSCTQCQDINQTFVVRLPLPPGFHNLQIYSLQPRGLQKKSVLPNGTTEVASSSLAQSLTRGSRIGIYQFDTLQN